MSQANLDKQKETDRNPSSVGFLSRRLEKVPGPRNNWIPLFNKWGFIMEMEPESADK